MINFKNIKTISSLFIGALLVVSCENSDLETENNLDMAIDHGEGFKSETGNSDVDLDITSDATSPIFTMHFDNDVSKEDAILEFDKAVESYLSGQQESTSIGAKSLGTEAFSTEWFVKVWTYTGTQTHNNTDGTVGTYLKYTTSAGNHYAPFAFLDNVGNDREGGWDAYLIRTFIPGVAIEWVEIDYGTIYLKGTDGWFITDFVAQLTTGNQSINATGFSQFWSEPNVWLDNDTDSGWDSYYTGNIGTGRLNF